MNCDSSKHSIALVIVDIKQILQRGIDQSHDLMAVSVFVAGSKHIHRYG